MLVHWQGTWIPGEVVESAVNLDAAAFRVVRINLCGGNVNLIIELADLRALPPPGC